MTSPQIEDDMETKYKKSQTFRVGSMGSEAEQCGWLPILTLPENMIGKTVRVTVEEVEEE